MEAINLAAIQAIHMTRSALPSRPGLTAAAAVFALTCSLLMSCAQLSNVTQGKDYTSLSTKLAKDMSERDVANTLGSTPDKAD
jgi:hypothetical protein